MEVPLSQSRIASPCLIPGHESPEVSWTVRVSRRFHTYEDVRSYSLILSFSTLFYSFQLAVMLCTRYDTVRRVTSKFLSGELNASSLTQPTIQSNPFLPITLSRFSRWNHEQHREDFLLSLRSCFCHGRSF